MRKSSHLFAILALSFFAQTAFAAVTVEIDKVKDKSLLASFSSTVLVCEGVNSSVDLQWNSSLTKSTGSPTTQSAAMIVSLRYTNTCTGDDITMTGFSLTPNGSEQADLSHAHVDAVVPVSTDPTLGPQLTANVTVNLNFVASGPASTVRNQSHSRDGGVLTVNDFSISSRPAVANGTVSGTLPLKAGPMFVNLVSGPSVSAQIGKDANGTIIITRKTK